MAATPKLRWYQFNLRGLFAIITVVALGTAAGIAWRSHQQFCREQANKHTSIAENEWQNWYSIPLPTLEQNKQQIALMDYHQRQIRAYDHAIWRPWERLWIDETPP